MARDLAIYGEALRSLQAAMDDPNTYSDPNVLCTIEVLGLFELLDYSRCGAWVQHIAGASQLIRLRGPHSFRTKYEKALLAALTGSIASESWRSCKACFFDEPEGQNTLKRIILKDSEPFCLRSEISIKLWSRASAAPGRFRRVGDIVHGIKHVTTKNLQALRRDVKEFCFDLACWYKEFKVLVKQRPIYRFYPSDYDMRYELLAGYHGMFSVGLRLQSALDGKDLEFLERQTLFHAECLRRMINEVSSANTWASFFLEQILVFEAAVMATTDIWTKNPHKPGQAIQNWKLAVYHHATLSDPSSLLRLLVEGLGSV